MVHVHVCLISEQLIPNLIPLLYEKPSMAVLLATDATVNRAEWLADILRPRGIKSEIQKISAYDFFQVSGVIKQVIKRFSGQARLTLNVTGGTKIAALAAFQEFYFADHRIIYQDTYNDRLLELGDHLRETPLSENFIGVREYLACYGKKMTNKGIPSPLFDQRCVCLQELCSFLVNNEGLLGRFNHAIDKYWNDRNGYAVIPVRELGDRADRLCTILEKCDAATCSGEYLYIPDEDKKFFCHGGWLEEYVYRAVRGLNLKGLNAMINVCVEWAKDRTTGMDVTNEFDVLFTWRNRLHIISCKTSNMDVRTNGSGTKGKEAVYELDSLADDTGGLFGKAMLVSARKLSPYSLARASENKIKVVDGEKVLRLPEILRGWINE